jgi:hypothetical protein
LQLSSWLRVLFDIIITRFSFLSISSTYVYAGGILGTMIAQEEEKLGQRGGETISHHPKIIKIVFVRQHILFRLFFPAIAITFSINECSAILSRQCEKNGRVLGYQALLLYIAQFSFYSSSLDITSAAVLRIFLPSSTHERQSADVPDR